MKKIIIIFFQLNIILGYIGTVWGIIYYRQNLNMSLRQIIGAIIIASLSTFAIYSILQYFKLTSEQRKRITKRNSCL